MSTIASTLDVPEPALESLGALREGILEAGLADWCVLDTGIVRGLAYYTGMVFEISDRAGKERAIAGGGRYDGLVELFGGPATPACGFGMGDVVLGLVLKDRGLLGEDDGGSFLSRPDAFVLSTTDAGAACVGGVLAGLRRAGLHARRSWKSTRNVGKLLAEAGKNKARFAIVLDDGVQSQEATLKDLQSTEQRTIAIDDIAEAIESAET
jgi:histidyl-tRNA synthetase